VWRGRIESVEERPWGGERARRRGRRTATFPRKSEFPKKEPVGVYRAHRTERGPRLCIRHRRHRQLHTIMARSMLRPLLLLFAALAISFPEGSVASRSLSAHKLLGKASAGVPAAGSLVERIRGGADVAKAKVSSATEATVCLYHACNRKNGKPYRPLPTTHCRDHTTLPACCSPTPPVERALSAPLPFPLASIQRSHPLCHERGEQPANIVPSRSPPSLARRAGPSRSVRACHFLLDGSIVF
jgi:hypothetical protein